MFRFVWVNCPQTNAELLEKVQGKTARIITGLRVNLFPQILFVW